MLRISRDFIKKFQRNNRNLERKQKLNVESSTVNDVNRVLAVTHIMFGMQWNDAYLNHRIKTKTEQETLNLFKTAFKIL